MLDDALHRLCSSPSSHLGALCARSLIPPDLRSSRRTCAHLERDGEPEQIFDGARETAGLLHAAQGPGAHTGKPGEVVLRDRACAVPLQTSPQVEGVGRGARLTVSVTV